ncbi:anti-sigma factor [Pseudonocardia sp. HH130630-07]|uniref:anti-sigma factor n=1 Tax=Pseudonocardia sp. HH130630-07 TaxID=1690815 RepID=UPI000814DA84|nr:anti-sigma factor [Pseudonocardia sp. HH130630-07]ANY05160.1 hypothetical protein AFB00_01195 [Pseudonocardia sp. HH130630-07]
MNEQTVGWALHALEPDEEFEVIEHLDTCAECRALVDDVSGVTAELAAALPQHEPPPGLRDAILEEARRTPQQTPQQTGSRRPAPEKADAPAPPPARTDRPLRSVPGGAAGAPARRRGPARVLMTAAAAAAAVVVIAGGGVMVGQLGEMRAERDASVAQAQQMQDALGAIARPGTTHAFLAAPADPARPVAAVVVGAGEREIVPMGLAPNSTEDQTYVLWGIEGDAAPKAVGTFDVRTGSAGPMSVPSAESGTFGTYAVSLENGRQAPASPSAVVATGQVGT